MNCEKRWLHLHTIQGYIAMWAVRQSPYHNPEGLGQVLDMFGILAAPGFDANAMAKMSRKEVGELLDCCLFRMAQVLRWNERKNGNPSPLGFCSRYDKPEPDNDFIDLGALKHNIVMELFRELDRDYEFDRQFDRAWPWRRLKSFLLSIRYRLFPIKPSNPTPL